MVFVSMPVCALGVKCTLPKPLDRIYWTEVKVQKVALAVLATLTTLGGLAVMGASFAGGVTAPLALLVIPFLGVAGFLGIKAWHLKDYEDPIALYVIRQKAIGLSFSQLCKEHGLEAIRKYEIVPDFVLKNKFEEEYQFFSFLELTDQYPLRTLITQQWISFEALQEKAIREMKGMTLNRFAAQMNLEELTRYGLLSYEDSLSIGHLEERRQKLDKQFNAECRQLDEKYKERQEVLLQNLDRKEKETILRFGRLIEKIEKEVLLAEASLHPCLIGSIPMARSCNFYETSYYRIQAATRPVREALEQEKDQIDSKRKEIQRQKKGMKCQRQYETELLALKREYSQEKDLLDQKFFSVQRAFAKKLLS